MDPFPCHLRSTHSLGSGVVPIEILVERVARAGYRQLAIADVDSIAGLVDAWRTAHAFQLHLVCAAELGEGDGRRSVVLLARDAGGFAALCRAITRRKLAGEAFDLAAQLADDSDGLHVLVADPDLAGELTRRLGRARARERLAVELVRPSPTVADDRRRLHAAEALGLELVAGGTVAFIGDGAGGDHREAVGGGDAAGDPPSQLVDERTVHRTLTAARTLRTVAEVDETLLLPPHRLPSAREFPALYADQPRAVAVGTRLARECTHELVRGTPIFPTLDFPAGESAYSTLYRRCHEGLLRRYPDVPPAAVARLAGELDVIHRMGFLEYFLIVGDIVAYARRLGIESVGRGSGAGSLVSYVLGITQVDPLRHRLRFERFLHPLRKDMPDIDIDLCWIGRDRVIEHVYERYGRDRVAMICTHQHLQLRSAVREVGRAHGLPPDTVDRLSARLPHHSSRALPELLRTEPALAHAAEEVPRPLLERVFRIAERVRGFPHHLSIHPGGIVIADRPIEHYVPLERAAKGILVTQLDMYSIEDLGLVKIDLLGNRCVSEVRETLDRVADARGSRPDLDRIPEDDAATARLLTTGCTLGCFQLESPAMRSLLTRLGTRDLAGVIHAIALVRPGPSQGGMKDRFIRCARGEEAPRAVHERIAGGLAGQYGILLYEEDVMDVAAAIAGMSLAEGDMLRRAIKRSAHLDDRSGLRELGDRFIARAIEQGVSAGDAREVWEELLRFGRYSFNKAHAASYGLLAYRAAYLKAHHPLEFFCALCNHHAGMYPFQAIVAEARRCGVRVLLPCVNRSRAQFTVERDGGSAGGGIRTPLSRLHGIARRTVRAIDEGRPFRSLADLAQRARPSLPELENLVLAGALDFTGRPRPRLIWEIHARRRTRLDGDVLAGLEEVAPLLPELPLPRRVAEELRLLGAGISRHPMEFFREARARRGALPLAEVPRYTGRTVRAAGIRIASRRVRTSRGEAMGFLTLEDETGVQEVVLFPRVWRRCVRRLYRDGPIEVAGRVEEQFGAISITASDVQGWSESPLTLPPLRPADR